MKNAKIHPDHVRAALRLEEHKLKLLLDAIELNDASDETINHQIRHIEEGLKRVRQLLPARKLSSWALDPLAPVGPGHYDRAA
jgi:hypothetical protein